MLLAEANQWPEDTRPYFGDGDECHMAFHFPLMPRMYMALAQEDRHPITDILRQTPEIPESCQWAIFLRNHDELTLEMVTDEERDYLWRVYATDGRARLNLGIRRRLGPLMGNDRRKIELMNALLMSMPGTPVIYYGDEIGMGDNIYLGDRDGVRTPMQWSAGSQWRLFARRSAAALSAGHHGSRLWLSGGERRGAQRDSASLLNWMRRLIQVRKQHRAFGRGSLSFLYPRNRKVAVPMSASWGDEQILCVANLAASAQSADLDLSALAGAVPVELLGGSAFPPIGTQPYTVMLQGLRLLLVPPHPRGGAAALVHRAGAALARIRHPGAARRSRQRHHAAQSASDRGRRPAAISVAPTLVRRQGQRHRCGCNHAVRPFRMAGKPPSVDLHRRTLRDGRRQRYFLPLSARWGEAQLRTDAQIAPFTLAKLREGPRVGCHIRLRQRRGAGQWAGARHGGRRGP